MVSVVNCRSAHRCNSSYCFACTWRYSLSQANRILSHQPRRIHAFNLTHISLGGAAFRQQRKSLHNSICYQRRQSRWWGGFGMWGWRNSAALRGIVILGSIPPPEFQRAVQRHGALELREIVPQAVREEVYRAACATSSAESGRYQTVKVSIEPLRWLRHVAQVSNGHHQ